MAGLKPNRIGWDNLSEGQRRRYERAGVSKADYDSGASLERARGHGNTPERPERAEKDRERYADYLERRRQLTEQVIEKKEQLFTSSSKFRADRSARYVEEGPARGKPPSMEKMKKFIDEGEDLFNDPDFDWGDDDWDFLYYH